MDNLPEVAYFATFSHTDIVMLLLSFFITYHLSVRYMNHTPLSHTEYDCHTCTTVIHVQLSYMYNHIIDVDNKC